MKIFKAPERFEPQREKHPFVFLAGSIEMDKAEDWQSRFEKSLTKHTGTILNPRRMEWDSSWKQTIEDDNFREQVEWELSSMEQADIIVVYFDPATKSPITLLELGLHAHDGKLVVCCPDGFYRKGNVDIVCNRYGIEQVDSLDELTEYVKGKSEISSHTSIPESLLEMTKKSNTTSMHVLENGDVLELTLTSSTKSFIGTVDHERTVMGRYRNEISHVVISEMTVSPTHRSNGIETAVCEELEKRFKQKILFPS